MKNKKTVFVLGAGANCPYGYPSGARLRERICLPQGFWDNYNSSEIAKHLAQKDTILQGIKKFKDAFNKSRIKSIDKFMAHNPTLATTGKYIIAFEIFRAEQQSHFGEEAKLEQERLEYAKRDRTYNPSSFLLWPLFTGEDWYSPLYNRLIEGLVRKDDLPDFSNGNLAFITFNYDRSLEQFLYEALSNSFTEVSEDKIIESLKQLKILHAYGQIAPLKWQNPNNYADYKPPIIDESLLQRAVNNIRTIYEEKQNPELTEAQNLLKQADEIFFLGFGYAPENMEVLDLPNLIRPECMVYGTAFGLIKEEAERFEGAINRGRKQVYTYHRIPTKIESGDVDCLMLLRKYLS